MLAMTWQMMQPFNTDMVPMVKFPAVTAMHMFVLVFFVMLTRLVKDGFESAYSTEHGADDCNFHNVAGNSLVVYAKEEEVR